MEKRSISQAKQGLGSALPEYVRYFRLENHFFLTSHETVHHFFLWHQKWRITRCYLIILCKVRVGIEEIALGVSLVTITPKGYCGSIFRSSSIVHPTHPKRDLLQKKTIKMCGIVCVLRHQQAHL